MFCALVLLLPGQNFDIVHEEPGYLSMANSGPGTNGSQFFITCVKAEWLDGKHVAFGKVLDSASMQVVRKMEIVPTVGTNSRPRVPVVVAECGQM
jgi:peptidyl-prolyl isomerase H (cyclophilin H)